MINTRSRNNVFEDGLFIRQHFSTIWCPTGWLGPLTFWQILGSPSTLNYLDIMRSEWQNHKLSHTMLGELIFFFPTGIQCACRCVQLQSVQELAS